MTYAQWKSSFNSTYYEPKLDDAIECGNALETLFPNFYARYLLELESAVRNEFARKTFKRVQA